MRKLDRLFEIMQLLRGQRLRTAEFLADELGVSRRTIYRDIQGLMASGMPIEGERGMGYMISQPIELPPLQFTPLELQTIKFGLEFARAAADPEMGNAAQEILIKINDALPLERRNQKIKTDLRVYFELSGADKITLSTIRLAIGEKQKIQLGYRDENAAPSKRIVRPLGLEYWGKIWTLTAWCELRADFRVFRIDRINQCEPLNESFEPELGKRFEDYLLRVNAGK